MPRPIVIGLVGDYDAAVIAHQAIPRARSLAGDSLGLQVELRWLPTDGIHREKSLARLDGLWCVPASPYHSTEGALRAIGFARRGECHSSVPVVAFSMRSWSMSGQCLGGAMPSMG